MLNMILFLQIIIFTIISLRSEHKSAEFWSAKVLFTLRVTSGIPYANLICVVWDILLSLHPDSWMKSPVLLFLHCREELYSSLKTLAKSENSDNYNFTIDFTIGKKPSAKLTTSFSPIKVLCNRPVLLFLHCRVELYSSLTYLCEKNN